MARGEMNLRCILLGLAVLLFAGVAKGQILYGSLTGDVADVTGAPIPGVKVEAANMGTGVSTEGVTDPHGLYAINNLQPGVYRVTIAAQGFSTVIHENVVLVANTTRRLDAQLDVAKVSQKITVSAPIEALQTDRSDVKSELNSAQVTSLPLGNDRNFQTLYTLVPGAAPPFASHSYAGNPTQALAMDINGGSDVSNITLIDGSIDTNFWEQNLIAYVPPSEAIENVNIVTSGFDAEQGSAAGSVTNVTIKSGTNSFHGSAFEFNTSNALQSRNYFFYGTKVPKFVLNQFGVSLGGPIKKNKLFFFGDWERYRLSQFGTGLTSVPTAAIRQGDFSSVSSLVTVYDPTTGNADGTGRVQMGAVGSAQNCGLNVICPAAVSSAASKMAALIPLPNYAPAGSSIANNYQYAGDLAFHRDSVDLKINYLPSERSTFFARYSAEPTFVFDPQQLGAAGGAALGSVSQPGNAYGLTQNTAVGGTYTFSPHWLLDVNVGYTRPRYSAENTDLSTNFGSSTLGIAGTNGTNPLQGGIPFFRFSSSNLLSTLGNSAVSNPFLFRDNQYTVAANVSWIKGTHSFRFGGTYQRYDLNRFQGQIQWGVRGGFDFTGGLTSLKGGAATNAYNSWADFLLGLAQGLGKDYVYMNPSTTRESEYALYIRDNWQVTKKPSVNYGVRWEYYPIPSHDHYGASYFDFNTATAFLGGVGGVPRNAGLTTGPGQLGPRVGFAYRLNEKTVVRAGYGQSSDPYPLNYMAWTYPAIVSQQITGANSFTPGGSLTAPFTGPTASVTPGIPTFSFPDLKQGKFPLPKYLGTYGYQSPYNRGYAEAWNLMVQRALPEDFNLQLGYVGNHMVREAEFINMNAGSPGLGNAGTPLYPQFQNPNAITFNSPFSGGSYNALQTQLTRRLAHSQIGVVYTYSKWIDDSDTEANSNVTWAYGPLRYRNKALAGLDRTHNLQIFAVYGSPFGRSQKWVTTGAGAKILGGWQVSPVIARMSGTPFFIGSSGSSCNCPGNTQTGDQVESTVKILGGHGPNAPYFDPLAFAPVTTARFGTSGRNIIRGPGYFNMNLSLVRDFSLKENLKLQFRAEAYGLTNTPNFQNPTTSGGTQGMGGQTIVSNYKVVNGVPNYGGYDIISSTMQTNTSFAGGPDRQFRFAMKLSF